VTLTAPFKLPLTQVQTLDVPVNSLLKNHYTGLKPKLYIQNVMLFHLRFSRQIIIAIGHEAIVMKEQKVLDRCGDYLASTCAFMSGAALSVLRQDTKRLGFTGKSPQPKGGPNAPLDKRIKSSI
jgi:hypothetical protein